MTSGNYGPPLGFGPESQPPQYGQPAPAPGGQPPQYGQPQPQYGPGYGQQPGYSQSSYGPPPGGGYPAPTDTNGAGRSNNSASFGVVGTVIAVIGAVLAVIGFTAVNWFSGGGHSKFSDVHDQLELFGPAAAGLSKAYFGWLAWVVLAVAVIAAIAACLPSPASGPLRAVGAVVGLAGIVLTFFAIKLTSSDIAGYSDYIKHARLGFYLALGGFLLTTVGSLVGPRRG